MIVSPSPIWPDHDPSLAQDAPHVIVASRPGRGQREGVPGVLKPSVDTHAIFLGGFGDDGPDVLLFEAFNAALKTDSFPSGQTTPRWPFRWCGM
jgi:hypothetical protein